MKTTIDIPEKELKDAIRFTGATTKREAVVTALKDFNGRRRIAALVKHFGTSETFMTHAELMKLRHGRVRSHYSFGWIARPVGRSEQEARG